MGLDENDGLKNGYKAGEIPLAQESATAVPGEILLAPKSATAIPAVAPLLAANATRVQEAQDLLEAVKVAIIDTNISRMIPSKTIKVIQLKKSFEEATYLINIFEKC